MSTVNNLCRRLLDTVKNVFFSGTLRVFLVFVLLVTSCTIFAVSAPLFVTSFAVKLMVINGIVFFHHWFGMILVKTLKIKAKFGSFIDFILLVAECTAVFSILKPWAWTFDRYDMSSFILAACAIYAQTACLCILLLIRFGVIVANVIDKPSAALAKPFDFFAMSNGDSKIDRLIDRLYSRSFSRDGSSVRNHDQHWFIFLLRSSGIVVVGISLLAVLFMDLVLEPVHETGMPPQKLFTTSTPPFPFFLEADNINWSIIPVFLGILNEGSELQDAIQVKALWDNGSDTIPQCGVRNPGRSADDIFGKQVDPFTNVVEFGCPDQLNSTDRKRTVLEYLTQPAQIWPDLLITVNFTALGIDPTSLSDYGFRTVSIVVGMHDDTADILRNTLPIPLVPDAHLLGGVLANIRYEYRRPKLASLGVGSSSTKKYLTSSVPFLTPDPSLNIPRDDNTATLRLYIQSDFSNWRVSIDYREKSILAGISALGGFWTVANGIFAIIFGTSLWWFLLGIKPLSTFGLIHKIPKFKPVLEDERQHGRYPNLLSDDQSDGGLLDYVHDHFVDLGPLESNRAGNAVSDPSAVSDPGDPEK